MSVAMQADRFNVTSLIDRNLEAGRGAKTAFDDGVRRLSYEELSIAVSQTGGLLHELGVRREDRLLLVLDDTVAFPIVFLGAMRIGAVPMPVSPLDKADNFRHYVDDSYARFVFADAPAIAGLRSHLGDREVTYVSVGGAVDGAIALESAIESQPQHLDPEPTHPDDVAFWLFSSGSTGPPKGVVHLHHDIGVTCENYASGVLGLSEDDITYSTTKLHHAYGLGNGLSFPLHCGATSILMPGPSKPGPALEALHRGTPTAFFSVPALYAAILAQPDVGAAFDSVRLCVSAAEALPVSTFERWKERFDLDIIDGIGSTEMLHIYCSNRPGEIAPGTTGRPVPGYELRLRDDEDRVIEGPATGDLEVRGDSCAAFYWHQHEKTKRSMRGDWFYTGDRYTRDERGNYVYEGRADDMLKIGGLWLSPVEMEGHLIAHENVVACGVVGFRREDLSRLAAFVVRTDHGPSDDELGRQLQEWCKERMRRYEYPHVVCFVDDLPSTLTGKVQRFRLRELTADL